jgi:hypothetical protein
MVETPDPAASAALTPDPAVVAAGANEPDDLDEGKKSFTPDEVEKKVQRRLKNTHKELDALKLQLKDYDAIKKDADEYKRIKASQQTEVERLANEKKAAEDKRIEAETNLAVLQVDLLKQKLCAKSILPADWWEDVRGTTEDEIKASISGLIKKLKLDKQRVGSPTPAGGSHVVDPNADVNARIYSFVGGGR